METQFAIEPERSRLDRLFVAAANLVRVERKACNAQQLMADLQ